MAGSVYMRLLPYEAEIWEQGFSWRGDPEALPEQVAHLGPEELLAPTTEGAALPRRIAGARVRPVPLEFARLPRSATLTGVAGVRRIAPPFCEGELLAGEALGTGRAVLLLLGPETVGWGLCGGQLRDAFRSLDEEAIGSRTTGAVETRWAAARLLQEGDDFARRLFTQAGLTAMPEAMVAWGYRLRMAVGRLAAALGGPPEAICLGGDAQLVEAARRELRDLGPVRAGRVAWGLRGWAERREG